MIHRSYTQSNAIPGNTTGPVQDQAFPSTSLMGAFLSRLPYAYQIIDSLIQKNPKFEDFKDVAPRRDEIIQDESVWLHEPALSGPAGAPSNILINKDIKHLYTQILIKTKIVVYLIIEEWQRMQSWLVVLMKSVTNAL